MHSYLRKCRLVDVTSDGSSIYAFRICIDVNISAKSGNGFNEYSFTPLRQALSSLFILNISPSIRESHPASVERIENYFDIIKLIVPRSDDFSFTLPTGKSEPCVVHFFRDESKHGWDDLITTKYLLRNGATADFDLFYDYIFTCMFEIRSFSKAFLKLIILAGCKFDKYFSELKSNPNRRPVDPANASVVQLVQDLATDLFSQPLSLQELSIMPIRKSISIPKLWAKIDSLPVPLLTKDKIKLKTYSESGRIDFDFKIANHADGQLCINICKSIL